MSCKTYINNVLVAFDQFCNVVMGGMPDETISARVGRAERSGDKNLLAIVLAEALNEIQPGHTTGAIEHDKERAEKVESIEEMAQRLWGLKH